MDGRRFFLQVCVEQVVRGRCFCKHRGGQAGGRLSDVIDKPKMFRHHQQEKSVL